jgi:hypothetical protein
MQFLLLLSLFVSCALACPLDNHAKRLGSSIPPDPHTPFATKLIPFKQETLDQSIPGSYGIEAVDVNGDGRMDLVTTAWYRSFNFFLASKLGLFPRSGNQVAWYENPSWKKRVIADISHAVHTEFIDIDGDGLLDAVVGNHFNLPPLKPEDGQVFQFVVALLLIVIVWQVHWFKQPATGDVWTPHPIGSALGMHRVVAGDFNGQLVVCHISFSVNFVVFVCIYLGDGLIEVIGIPLFGNSTKPSFGPAAITIYSPLDRAQPTGRNQSFSINGHCVLKMQMLCVLCVFQAFGRHLCWTTRTIS